MKSEITERMARVRQRLDEAQRDRVQEILDRRARMARLVEGLMFTPDNFEAEIHSDGRIEFEGHEYEIHEVA